MVTAIVTGAARGIGASVAAALEASGLQVGALALALVRALLRVGQRQLRVAQPLRGLRVRPADALQLLLQPRHLVAQAQVLCLRSTRDRARRASLRGRVARHVMSRAVFTCESRM